MRIASTHLKGRGKENPGTAHPGWHRGHRRCSDSGQIIADVRYLQCNEQPFRVKLMNDPHRHASHCGNRRVAPGATVVGERSGVDRLENMHIT